MLSVVPGRAARTQAVSGAVFSRRPGLTWWDQHVSQDGEASHGLGAGQHHAAAKEPEQDVVGGPAQEVHGSEEHLEEEDVTAQALQVEDQPVVGDHVGEAAGQSHKSGGGPSQAVPRERVGRAVARGLGGLLATIRRRPDRPGGQGPAVS